jgi:hypothetical protein
MSLNVTKCKARTKCLFMSNVQIISSPALLFVNSVCHDYMPARHFIIFILFTNRKLNKLLTKTVMSLTSGVQ